jgi:hypothetical protein
MLIFILFGFLISGVKSVLFFGTIEIQNYHVLDSYEDLGCQKERPVNAEVD